MNISKQENKDGWYKIDKNNQLELFYINNNKVELYYKLKDGSYSGFRDFGNKEITDPLMLKGIWGMRYPTAKNFSS